MFVGELDGTKLAQHQPRFTVVDAAGFNANRKRMERIRRLSLSLNLGRGEALIGGTQAGEIKKTMLTVMTYRLPERNVLPMHCSANYGAGIRRM